MTTLSFTHLFALAILATLAAADDTCSTCSLYMAESTIPGAGLGIFTATERFVGDHIGQGDVLLPVVDVAYHFRARATHPDDYLYDYFGDYIWWGPEMGMQQETSHPSEHVSAFCPGLDAAINCNLALINVDKATPVYDTVGLHRDKDPGVGAYTPYYNVSTVVKEYIPEGGELFKYYGDHWFTTRENIFGAMPLSEDYPNAESLMLLFMELMEETPTETHDDLWSFLVESPFVSRTLNAVPKDRKWLDVVAQEGIRGVYQPNATRPLEELAAHGRCLDNIRPAPSSLPQAGRGAFATRDMANGSIITGSPLIYMPNGDYFPMYEGDWFDKTDPPDGNDVVHQQLTLNYCWTSPHSSIHLCPYGVVVNYINHNQTLVNAKWVWAKDGDMGHKQSVLEQSPESLVLVPTPGLFVDLVATKDIAEGDEIFVDYGDVWEQAWQSHVDQWVEGHSGYVSARDWNLAHASDMLRTPHEQEVEPYPSYYEMRCLDEALQREEGNPMSSEEAVGLWFIWTHGYPCEILERRRESDGSYMYRVEYREMTVEQNLSGTETQNVGDEWWESDWIVREAIQFVDQPYSSDMSLPHSFRHPIAIPDILFPDRWKGYELSSEHLNRAARRAE